MQAVTPLRMRESGSPQSLKGGQQMAMAVLLGKGTNQAVAECWHHRLQMREPPRQRAHHWRGIRQRPESSGGARGFEAANAGCAGLGCAAACALHRE